MNKNKKRKSVIAIGNFDGFHPGHKKIIRNLKDIAAAENLASHILTFTPNPRQYFNKETPLIFTDAQKKKFLEEQKVDQIAFLNFIEISRLPADTFVTDYLVKKFAMRYIVVGDNFKFGKNRAGDIDVLKKLAAQHGFDLRIVEPVVMDGIRISSSIIREKLANGNFEAANRLLGRPYRIEGVITEGDKMGRELGFPTINVKTGNTLLPEGVFKSKVEIDGETFDSITNIGHRPTFSGMEKRVESHLFGFDRIAYGKEVTVYFEKKLRDEIKFSSKNNLIEQIRKDIENLRI